MRSEGTHVAVGGTLFGVGVGVLLSLAAIAPKSPWGTAWFVVGFGLGCLATAVGVYLLLAVFVGLPLPETRAAREAAPDLRIDAIAIVYVYKDYARNDIGVVFRVGVNNRGRGDVRNASVNLLVPDFVTHLCRSDGAGVEIAEGAVAHTSESIQADANGDPISSFYWNDQGRTFPGRTAYPIDFRVNLPSHVLVRVEFKLVSSDLPTGLGAWADLDPSL